MCLSKPVKKKKNPKSSKVLANFLADCCKPAKIRLHLPKNVLLVRHFLQLMLAISTEI